MTDPRTDQEAVLTNIRDRRLDATSARGRASYCRSMGTSSGLTSEQLEENAQFWDHIADLVDSGQADWLD